MDIKEKIGSRITEFRKELGITIKELAARTETLSAARISNWEQGTRSPGPREAKLLAKILHVSPAYLLCLTDNPQGELLENRMNRLVPLLKMRDALQATEELPENTKTIMLDQFNSALASRRLFAIQIEDASMKPIFKEGDLAIIDAERSPNPGDFVLASLSSKKQTVLRRYGEAETCLFQLLPNNELWATVNVKGSNEATILGVVVECRWYL